jgi:hypothetical protein
MKHPYLLSIVVLTALVFSGGCIGTDTGPVNDRTPYETTCGGIAHTVNYLGTGLDGKTCCGNTLYTSTELYDCCGEKYYPTDQQICCGGDVYNVYNYSCCNGKAYDRATRHCCNGNLEAGGGYYEHNQDCGGQCYDFDTQRCCNQKVYNLNTQSCCQVYEGDNEYNQSSPWQIMKIHEGKDSCCQGRPNEINGTFCQPGSGVYASPDSGSGCTSGGGALSCADQKFWRDRPDLKH